MSPSKPVVSRFMLGTTWDEGCKSCSLIADHFEPSVVHLAARDTALVAISTYGRGLDLLIGAYNYLDLTPLGRQEDGEKYGMEWVRHHDRYATP